MSPRAPYAPPLWPEDLERAGVITFRVDGDPRPQGSLRAFVQGRRAVITHSGGPTLGAWRQAVAARCSEAIAGRTMFAGPVMMTVLFTLPRPKAHFGARGIAPRFVGAHPIVAPDIDKLARAVMDSITGIGFRDDAQVVQLVARKTYGEPPGLVAELSEVA